jgi:hypothetical protein
MTWRPTDPKSLRILRYYSIGIVVLILGYLMLSGLQSKRANETRLQLLRKLQQVTADQIVGFQDISHYGETIDISRTLDKKALVAAFQTLEPFKLSHPDGETDIRLLFRAQGMPFDIVLSVAHQSTDIVGFVGIEPTADDKGRRGPWNFYSSSELVEWLKTSNFMPSQ